MVASTEIREIILRWYKDLSKGKLDSTYRLYSTKQAGFLAIGSDPDEWWSDPAIIMDQNKAMIAADGVELELGDLEAYSEGTVGWAISRLMVKSTRGIEIPLRCTCVLHREDGDWKIVHFHGSVGVPNEEIMVEKE